MLRPASNLQWSPTRLPVWPTKALRDCGSPDFPPSSYLPLIHLTLTFYHSIFNFSKNSIYFPRRHTCASFPGWNILLGTVRKAAWYQFWVHFPCNIVVWHIAGAHCVGWKNTPHGFLSRFCLTPVSELHFWKPARYPLLKRGIISTLETKPFNVSKPVPPPPESNMIYTVDFMTMSFSFICSTCPKS